MRFKKILIIFTLLFIISSTMVMPQAIPGDGPINSEQSF